MISLSTNNDANVLAEHYSVVDSAAELRVLHRVFDGYIGQRSWSFTEDYLEAGQLLHLEPGKSFLDLGCGFGGPAKYLVDKFGCNVVGVDINPLAKQEFSKLRTSFMSKSRWQFANSLEEALSLVKGNQFDAILINDAVCHFRDRKATLTACFNSLKSGGRLFMTDPVVLRGNLSASERELRTGNAFFDMLPLEDTMAVLSLVGLSVLMIRDTTERLIELSERYTAEYLHESSNLISAWGNEAFYLNLRRLAVVNQTARNGRLTRFLFLAEKQG